MPIVVAGRDLAGPGKSSAAGGAPASMGSGGGRPSVALIIPTYGRPAMLLECLRTALDQDYPDYEIIIVAQSLWPNDELTALVSAHDEIKCYSREEPNLPGARNCGVRKTAAEIVIFVDDDTLLPREFITRHVANYSHSQIDGVAGAVLAKPAGYKPGIPPALRNSLLAPICGNWQHDQRMEVAHACGCNHSFRRRMWEAVGGFDERYTGAAFREESDFFLRAHRLGFHMVYDPTAWLVHIPGAQPGGCWMGFDGLESAGRYSNHAYFVLKNYRARDWPYMFFNHFRRTVLRRKSIAHPRTFAVNAWRFANGWTMAVGLIRSVR